ncbi:FtsK/SpoIIIE family DNA translocase [Pontibacillus litoralis]|uniref:Cell division protein FtsK n=1 Tax=Pontibacillus litoralis JSM 072002 TaxID=1385512 RepID=A0A0A5HXP5_9BACI|nr:DNA translocase FtsK [Pontibacillus litoralis]KGX88387.1 cell division protein FtsK [Pontibacillus litoralis JSM 072002]
MARNKKQPRKRKKKQPKMKDQVRFELVGLLLVFLAVFGSGASAIAGGFIPNTLVHIFQFFFGVWYFLVSVFLFIVGIYLMIKRKWPLFLHKRFVGLYIMVTALILLTHIISFEDILKGNLEPSIIRTTWNHYGAYLAGDLPSTHIGGGMVGGALFAFTYYLFAPTGAKIVAVFLFIVGLLFLTEISLGDLLQRVLRRGKVFWQDQWSMLQKQKQEWKEKKAEQRQQKEIEVVESQDETSLPMEASQGSEPIIQDFTAIAYGDSATKRSHHEKKPEESTSEEANGSSDELDDGMAPSLPLTEVENVEYELPSLDLLAEPVHNAQHQERSKIQATVKKLEQTFHSFGVKAKVTKVHVGPSVTKYEVYPDVGVKVSKIVNLHDDIALALAAKDIRIEAPIPGKSAVGIEVPNQEVATVSLREVIESHTSHSKSKLLFGLGRDIGGGSVVSELNKMPHLLVAGATGSGKSVCINGIITSILMRAKPHEVKMMMIDPKKVELNVYNGIPHLLTPVVTDPKKASRALKKVVDEMERRYDLFSDTSTRNIEGYNEHIRKYNVHVSEEEQQPQLPYIVVLVDELADLMMVASNDVEDAITRLAQMARAAGIHLIIATQRPSVDVITGVIKANIPSRIAFSVSSATDSRTILDTGGAEKLLGRGDMLFIPVGSSKPARVQGAFLSDEEVERVVNHCIEQQQVQYQEEMAPSEEVETKQEVDDELFDDAVQLVVEMQSASVSMLQRRFRIGYTRAARLIDAMEDRNIVGPYGGSKPRDVLISKQSEEQTS